MFYADRIEAELRERSQARYIPFYAVSFLVQAGGLLNFSLIN